MNLSVNNNNYMKPQNNSFLLSEPPTRKTFLNDSRRLPQITENNNQICSTNGNDKTIREVWSIQNFQIKNNKVTVEQTNYNNIKMSWADEKQADNPSSEIQSDKSDIDEDEDKMEIDTTAMYNQNVDKGDATSPSHHARRPMNAFLIFCKKHRPIVREKYKNLENRGVTRILGEWWALLDIADKQPFTDLAKEYKDAFLSANPDFKWYKLPAPPLRTLTTRPPHPIVQKIAVPLSSPSNNNLMIPSITPGKLADESQLGGLTSLMNDISTKPKTNDCCKQLSFQLEDNNNSPENDKTNFGDSQLSPVNLMKTTILPPKPLKKRNYEQYEEDNNLKEEPDCEQQSDSNITNQDLMNKVVDDIFSKQNIEGIEPNGLIDFNKERKSNRQCKGKRYEQFMYEGKLLGNKRDTKLIQQQKFFKYDHKLDTESNSKQESNAPKLDLGETIKRLKERTSLTLDFDTKSKDEEEFNINRRIRTISENSDCSNLSKNLSPLSTSSSPTSSFNLDLRITNLPSLSYDMFLQRKKESKKRKIRSKTDGESKHKMQKLDKNDKQLVGSKKRKNKQSITHFGKPKVDTNMNNNNLLVLATIAEMAAETEKNNEKISE